MKNNHKSGKRSWLRFILAFILGTAAAAVLGSLFGGPRLGLLYDFLLRHRPALPAANELLIIDTDPQIASDNILEPSAVSSVLLTMTELNASALILQAPVLGLSAGSSAGEEEIRYNFDREFGILDRNIRNFFDAIRTGSIEPSESALYVNDLLDLAQRGKERLVSTLVTRDEEGIKRLEQAAAAFGNFNRPGDLLVQVIRAGENDNRQAFADSMEYSHNIADSDGVLRRILPMHFTVNGSGPRHIILSALEDRYKNPRILESETGSFLVMENQNGAELKYPLDSTGALLFEVPHDDFRRVSLADFLNYNEADQSLYRLLGEAQALGIYSLIQGEDNPVFLYDYALALREDMLANTTGAQKKLWINARNDYFKHLDNFLNGTAETDLLESLGLILPDGALFTAESGRVKSRYESLISAFDGLRDKYNELKELRAGLESTLAGSLCIMGPCSIQTEPEPKFNPKPLFPFLSRAFAVIKNFIPVFPKETWTDTEASALLANTILTGRFISPGDEFRLFIGAAAAALLIAFFLRTLNSIPCLFFGLILTFFAGAGASVFFVITGTWYDPLVVAAAGLTATVFSFIWVLVLNHKFKLRFRSCYGPSVSQQWLRGLIAEGRPAPAEVTVVNAVIVAVRNSELVLHEDRETPESALKSITSYREKVSLSFKKAGAVIAGNGGDLILACFGSPLELVVAGKTEKLPASSVNTVSVIRAAGFLAELLNSPESGPWSFGLDCGPCAFSWTPLTGYSVFGRPVIRARILSGLTERYRARALVTGSVNEALPDLPAKKMGILKEKDGYGGEPFYELLF
ncbi:MAG: hypothetical protein FWD78_11735 [Treponema sp.]|nr:hypothetical protein [Treponema sp.]